MFFGYRELRYVLGVFLIIGLLSTTYFYSRAGNNEREITKTRIYKEVCDVLPNSDFCDVAKQLRAEGNTDVIVINEKGPCFPLGNANDSSRIDVKDVRSIYRYETRSSKIKGIEHADVNADGNINIEDAKIIGQYLTGQRDSFPGCDSSQPSNVNGSPSPTPFAQIPTPIATALTSPSPTPENTIVDPPIEEFDFGDDYDYPFPDPEKIFDDISLGDFDFLNPPYVIDEPYFGESGNFLSEIVLPGNDNDLDGFSNEFESYLGTDPNSACSTDSEHNAWPPDINNSKTVNFVDFILIVSRIGTQQARYDLNVSGNVSIRDLFVATSYFAQTCTS